MKYLLILLALSVGCTRGSSKPRFPKHVFGETVSVKSGFYKGITGTVKDWRHCYITLENGDSLTTICYNIVTVKTDSTAVTVTTTNDVSEEELSN